MTLSAVDHDRLSIGRPNTNSNIRSCRDDLFVGGAERRPRPTGFGLTVDWKVR